MGTSGLIAFKTGDDLQGTSHNFDSYTKDGLGENLFHLCSVVYKDRLPELRDILLAKEWCSITDWNGLPETIYPESQREKTSAALYYDDEPMYVYNRESAYKSYFSYRYIIDIDNRTMLIESSGKELTLSFDAPAPNWDEIEAKL